MNEFRELKNRILVLTPLEQDNEIIRHFLLETGHTCELCQSAEFLKIQIGGGVGAIVITDEVLASESKEIIYQVLAAQPRWSDIPVILLSGTRDWQDTNEAVGNLVGTGRYVTVLERPLRPATFLTAIRSALKARRRQYQVEEEILARKAVERELFETNRRLQALMDALPVGVSFSDDQKCERVTGNRALLAQFEVDSSDNVSASAPDSTAPGRLVRYFQNGDELRAAELPLQRAVRENQVIPPTEMRVELPSGKSWLMEASAAPVSDSSGNIIGGVAVTIDITERKNAEANLKADLETLTLLHVLSRRLLEGRGIQPLLQEIMDAAVTIAKAGKGTLQLLESDRLRIFAQYGHQQSFLEFFASGENVPSVCGESMKCGERVVVSDIEESLLFSGTDSLPILREAGVRAVQSTPIISRNGALLGILTIHWGEPHTPDDQDLWRIDLLVRQAADLIEHAKAEEALRVSESRFRAIVQASSDVIYRMSPDWSEMLYLTGREFIADSESASNSWLEKYIHPDDQPMVLATINEAIQKRSTFELEHRVIQVDGSLGWTFSRAVPISNQDGMIKEWFGAAINITGRKHMEEELRNSRDELALRVRELDEKTKNLEEVNIALKVLLKQREDDQKEFGEAVLLNMQNLVLPYLEKLKKGQNKSTHSTLIEIIESHLGEVTSSFTRKIGIQAADLTPTEMRIAALIKDGKSSGEIAEILNSSEKTIEVHRSNIRKKLGLQSRRSNLRSHLLKLT